MSNEQTGFFITSRHVLALMIFAFSMTLAQAADDAKAQLAAAQSIKCRFGPGTEAKWNNKEPVIGSSRFDEDVQFDSIDLGKQSARIIGNSSAGDVIVLNSGVGLSFLETAIAVVDITTVFATYTGNHEFPAVESRHVNLFGKAMAEQFYGTCKIWQ